MVTKGRQRPLVFANEEGGALRPLLRLGNQNFKIVLIKEILIGLNYFKSNTVEPIL